MQLDNEAICAAALKTGRVIVLHEDCMTGGIGGELVVFISENCFELLDDPMKRGASLDTTVAFAGRLEQQSFAEETFGRSD